MKVSCGVRTEYRHLTSRIGRGVSMTLHGLLATVCGVQGLEAIKG